MALVCPNCGNQEEFLVKTAQLHDLRVVDGRVNVANETRPAVFEVLCDKCDAELDFASCDEATRQEILLTIGAQ